MNYKYRKIYEKNVSDKIIRIVQSKSFYVLQYCRNTCKDFSRKAKRYKSVDLDKIIKFCNDKFDLNISKSDLLINSNPNG